MIKCGRCKKQSRYFIQDKTDKTGNGYLCEECFAEFIVWAKKTGNFSLKEFEERFEVKAMEFVFR